MTETTEALIERMRAMAQEPTPDGVRSFVQADVLALIDIARGEAAGDWVPVPREPTQEMLDSVTAADQREPFTDEIMRGVYREMLAAAPTVAVGEVRVKALEWQKENIDGTAWTGWAPVSGQYIVKFTGGHWEAIHGILLVATRGTCAEAKAAGDEHHEARIRSALVPPPPQGEPVTEAEVEAAYDQLLYDKVTYIEREDVKRALEAARAAIGEGKP